MGYDSKHISIKTPKDWYNNIADQYNKYHKHLDSFDKWFFLRVLPRNLDSLEVIDLGAWDGRVRKFFEKTPIKKYTACDISEKILKRHPWTKKTEKIICDLEQDLPFDDNSYQLALSFFVLEHIHNIDNLCKEVYRILSSWWQRIIGHFLQRREFIWKKDKESFKIELYNHRIQEIEKIAKDNNFSIDIFPIREQKTTIWYILSLKKN